MVVICLSLWSFLTRLPISSRSFSSGEADQETVYLGEGALFRESGFGYGKPCGYGAVKAGQSSDPAPYHAPVLETECPEFEGSTVPCPDPAEVDLEDAGLIVSCDL